MEQSAIPTLVPADGLPTDVDVAVIGGGLAGLVAAIESRQAGATVVLLERSVPGGRARADVTGEGFVFDRGNKALYVDQALHLALQSYSIEVEGSAPDLRGAQLYRNGRAGFLPQGPMSLLRTEHLGFRDKVRFAAALAKLPRITPADLADQSVAQWLDAQRLTPAGRAVVEVTFRLITYSTDFDIASADATVAQMQRAMSTGVLYVDGGWHQIVDKLAATAVQRGVQVVTSAEVGSVDSTDVRLRDGALIRAGAVIVAGLSPANAARLVTDAADLTEAAGPAVHAATAGFVVRPPGTVPCVVNADAPLYCSRYDPPARLVPDGYGLYGATRYLGRDEHHDPRDTKAQFRQQLALQGVTADSIVEERYFNRLTAAHGQPLAARGGLGGRPRVDDLGVPNVFVAGDWVGPTGLLADAAAASAQEAAMRALAVVGKRV